ncbi:HAD-IIB family hydrolase [Ancylobacter oerskovii]|uniref:HAD-IIB family hydrolase n=1 Tax=Ancylobacter oerskovii TaxID=459519 RepID=A0ABW4YVU7_9HYPH|nr:HAD-IIB family hydrolase [Ancylobacter oerskovii]MBS7543177.1 HAD-IIB family hydrolase [Ancylobacter oerskovii]
MRPLRDAAPSTFAGVRFVLTDMDETLTYRGRLAARTYGALERLQQAGVTVMPVTAAPAGWCDQMARMWPVDGVIGENGGLFFRRDGEGHGIRRLFWHGEGDRPAVAEELARIARAVQAAVPSARLAEDQPFRLTSIAFAQPEDPGERSAIASALRAEGAEVTLNNLWVLGWLGGYDKLAMARRVLADGYGLDVAAEPEAVLYVGDSTNDAPMFGFFPHSVGVSTVTRYLQEIATPPAWIAAGPGGEGFVEAADAVLAARAG